MFDCFQTDEEAPDIVLPEGKVGAKKMRKLEEKAERKRQREVSEKVFFFKFNRHISSSNRENSHKYSIKLYVLLLQAELQEREEKKRREAKLEEQRKREEAKREAEEAERVKQNTFYSLAHHHALKYKYFGEVTSIY